MSRRKSDSLFDNLFELFMLAPWWVIPIIAGLAYILFAFILPPIIATNSVWKPLSDTSRVLAPLVVIMILTVGAAATLRKWRCGVLLDNQSGEGTINSLTWQEFEELIGAAYRRQGYKVVETGGGGADGGIDLLLYRDGQEFLVQCKHWRSSQVGVKLIRELHGLAHCKEHSGSRGIFVTFGNYTQEAVKFARDNGIELVDRKRLLDMIQSAKKNNPEPVVNKSPAAEKPSATCPICDSPMVLRTARRGNKAGSKFWGCSLYPKCKGTMDY